MFDLIFSPNTQKPISKVIASYRQYNQAIERLYALEWQYNTLDNTCAVITENVLTVFYNGIKSHTIKLKG